MKGIDNYPKSLARFLYSNPVLIEQHVDGVVLTGTREAEAEAAALVPLGFSWKGPANETEGIPDRLGERHVVLHINNLQRTLPCDLFISGLAEVVIVIERADAEDQQITRAEQAAVNMDFQEKAAHASDAIFGLCRRLGSSQALNSEALTANL